MGHKRDPVLCTNNVKQGHKYSPTLPEQGRQGDKHQRDAAGQLKSDTATIENSTEAPQKIK